MRRKNQRGSTILEFALASLMLVPMALGSWAIGMALSKYIQTSNVGRSAASMFMRGADFGSDKYKRILGKVAIGLGMTDSNGAVLTTAPGKGVVILTTLRRIGGPQCAAGGFLPPGYNGCTNRNMAVVVKRVVVGNSSLRDSEYGRPPASPNSDGSYATNDFLTLTSSRATVFGVAPDDNTPAAGAPLELTAGMEVFISETYFEAPEVNIFPAIYNMTGFYHRYFF